MLVILLFVTQVVFDLYARSAVTAAAVDAARSVAGYASSDTYAGPGAGPAEQRAIATAESRARAALGRWGDVTTFAWRFLPTDGPPTTVELEVTFDASASGFNVARPLALPGLNHFDRTVRVRVERITCPPTTPCQVDAGP